MNEYANIKKYWTTDKEKNFFAFKCGEVLFESLNNKLLLLFWNYKKRNLEKTDYSLLKEIEQRALNNGVYIDKNTDYCIQKLENFFTKFAYGGTIEQLADSVENKFKELLAANASLNCIKPIVQTKLALEHSGIFIKNATIEEYIAKLLDSQVSNVFVSGPSGIGKTRLIYESFYNLKDNLSVFYASYQADQENRLEDEFKNIILDKSNSNGVVIIDDCPSTFFRKLQDIRNNGQSKLKIIAANNDVSTKIIDIKNEAETIFLSPNIFKDSIECYIENELQNKGVSINTIKIIAQASDGYPQIAIKLVSNYINGKQIGWHTVEHKMPNLLDLNPQVDKRGIIIMQTLSLCMPFPYNGESRNAFKYLLNTEYFTPLGDVDYTKRRSLAEQLIHKYKSTFVDINGDWLNIHPLGLSIWLTEQWFETVCNNNEHFKELIEDVQKQDINIQNIIIDGFCRHIKQMYGVKSASDLIQELTDMDGANSFFNAEVICSRFGSELLYAMSTVNPLAVANCLYEIIDAQSIEWLKKHFADDNRKNIVFALEKMCFANESYDKAVMTMAKLAVAENDNIGNNATGLLQQLFHI
jgi:Cdc6-like AAA superfamily ATPase